MVINSHEPAKDRNKQNRENKNRVKKSYRYGKGERNNIGDS